MGDQVVGHCFDRTSQIKRRIAPSGTTSRLGGRIDKMAYAGDLQGNFACQQIGLFHEPVMPACPALFFACLHIGEKNAIQGIDANLETEHYI